MFRVALSANLVHMQVKHLQCGTCPDLLEDSPLLGQLEKKPILSRKPVARKPVFGKYPVHKCSHEDSKRKASKSPQRKSLSVF